MHHCIAIIFSDLGNAHAKDRLRTRIRLLVQTSKVKQNVYND